jgi:hypothetical protein
MSVLHKYFVAVTVLIAAMALSACEKTDSPEVVSRAFWAAVQAGDMKTAQTYAVPGSLESKAEAIKTGDFDSEFTATVIKDNLATVSTNHKGSQNGTPLEYQFNTVLTQVDKQWKVDIKKTTQSLVPAAMTAAFSGFGQALNQSLSNIGDTFGQEADNIGSLLGQVLNQGIDEMSREMEKASAEISQSAEQASNSGFEMAAELGRELSKELSQELQNAGSIYQQKVNELKAAQLKKQPQTISAASIDGSIHGTAVNLTQARYQQALELYSGDSWSANPSLLIFLFADEEQSIAGKRFEFNAHSFTDGQPHVHLRWRDPDSGEIKTEIASRNYDMSLIFSAADNQGNLTATLAFAKDTTQINGSFTLKQ